MKPAVIKINLHQNHPWKGWAADVWCDNELRITGYGDTKAEAVAKARLGYRMCRLTRRWNIAPDVEINEDLLKLFMWGQVGTKRAFAVPPGILQSTQHLLDRKDRE